jgi:hypothetical protein
VPLAYRSDQQSNLTNLDPSGVLFPWHNLKITQKWELGNHEIRNEIYKNDNQRGACWQRLPAWSAAVIGKMEMLGGVGDDGVINLISYVVCLANFMDLQVGLEDRT